MSEQNKPDEKSSQATFGIAIVAILLSLLAVQDTIFKPTRPAATNTEGAFSEDVRSRLWQDPFQAVEEHRKRHHTQKTPGNSIVAVEISHKNEISHKFKIIEDRKNKENVLIKTSSSGDNQNYEHGYGHEPVHVCESIDRTTPYPDSEAIKHSIEELNCEIKKETKKPDSSLHALAIMLPGSPYAEDKERRLRTRYAVVSALAENGYVPNDPEHIDFIDFDKTCKAALRELRGNELAETEKKLSADKRKTLEEKTRFCHMGAFMPYEWFKHQDKDKDRHTILVLWLDDNGFSGTQAPLRTLGFLREKINGIDPNGTKLSSFSMVFSSMQSHLHFMSWSG